MLSYVYIDIHVDEDVVICVDISISIHVFVRRDSHLLMPERKNDSSTRHKLINEIYENLCSIVSGIVRKPKHVIMYCLFSHLLL